MPSSQNRDKPAQFEMDFPDHYDRLHSQFRWKVDAEFNMGQVCCERWGKDKSASKNIAIIEHSASGDPLTYTYLELFHAAGRAANALKRLV
jgi:acetyl-CoA synthetase